MFGIEHAFKRFQREEYGSASTEWMVAVSIVVMMAVPVLGLVGGGAGESSDDLVVSIQDTDSMGGDGFHGDEGAAEGAYFTTEDFVPGSDMGVGFPDGDAAQAGTFVASAGDDKLRAFAGASGTTRRDKPGSSLFAHEDEVVATDGTGSGADRRPYKVPSAPVLVSQRLRVSDDNCVEDIVADIPDEDAADIVPVKVVLASGR